MSTALPPDVAEIIDKVSRAAFGSPLVNNVLRGHVAEAIIHKALEPDWRWCSADYSPWDFEHPDGVRLEVKQSAARQSWTNKLSRPAAASFDIAPRKAIWEDGKGWIPSPGRQAHLYVLAHHAVDDDSADHRAPHQWTFYVIAARDLPDTKRLTLKRARQLDIGCSFAELRQRVAEVAAML